MGLPYRKFSPLEFLLVSTRSNHFVQSKNLSQLELKFKSDAEGQQTMLLLLRIMLGRQPAFSLDHHPVISLFTGIQGGI